MATVSIDQDYVLSNQLILKYFDEHTIDYGCLLIDLVLRDP